MMSWVIESMGLDALERLAQRLALIVRPGDVITLEGGLGAGKTTFARFLIQSLLGPGNQQEIPSPTFSLQQSYETSRMGVHHFDFYRLTDKDEVLELGVSEPDDTALKVIEWPERAEDLLSEERLNILFEDDADSELRRLTLTGSGDWDKRLGRLQALQDFLDRAGWGQADVAYLQGDASARTYARISDGLRKAILMDSPRVSDGAKVRGDKTYSEIAHLAEDIRPFVAVAGELKSAGLKVPEIFSHDLDQGFLVLEDLGDGVFTSEVAKGRDVGELYRPAVDVLLALRSSPPPNEIALGDGAAHQLASYDSQALMIEVELLIDWYWRFAKGIAPTDAEKESFIALWKPIAAELSEECDGWVLRDFHSPNLLWLDDGGVGVIDFQDAVRGHWAYDLMSLLQDARLDVSPQIEAELLSYYCEVCERKQPGFSVDTFKARYAMLGAQRNTKIVGIFARLAERDGKRAYLEHLPRIWRYLVRDLSHPDLQDLRQWYEDNFPDEFREAIG